MLPVLTCPDTGRGGEGRGREGKGREGREGKGKGKAGLLLTSYRSTKSLRLRA
jgi:hypothetical protein